MRGVKALICNKDTLMLLCIARECFTVFDWGEQSVPAHVLLVATSLVVMLLRLALVSIHLLVYSFRR